MGGLNDHDPALTSAAQRWVVRLTSGEITEREMRRFRDWAADPDNERIFKREMVNWRKLGVLREGLEGIIGLPFPALVMRRRRMRRCCMIASFLRANLRCRWFCLTEADPAATGPDSG